MRFYKFQNIPQKYNQTKKELKVLMNDYNPADILIKKFFGKPIPRFSILIEHKPIGKIARFYRNKIFLDFNNSSRYLWLSICHETAHILFRLYGWEKSNIYKILKNNYQKNMTYSIDQSCAILFQAYCENLLKIRPLRWNFWESTFEGMDVKEMGSILWPEFLKYIKERKNYSVFVWLEKIEKEKLFD